MTDEYSEQFIHMIGKYESCQRCGARVLSTAAKWLELDCTTGIYHDPLTDPVTPEENSQGGFAFGPDCAKVVLDNGGQCKRIITRTSKHYRKPAKVSKYEGNTGYVCEHDDAVVYDRSKGFDADAEYRWVIVCEKHSVLTSARTLAAAKASMKAVDFCEECSAAPTDAERMAAIERREHDDGEG